MAHIPLGTALLGRYVLVEVSGRGGVSTVYAAVDVRRGRRVAVKVFAPLCGEDAGRRDDCRREALITDAVRHPGVPRVLGYGDLPVPGGPMLPYLLLQFVAGTPLSHRLSAGPMDWPEAVRIAAATAEALAAVHRCGVVHRDLAARNVMVTRTGATIVDFGLASGHPGGSAHERTASTGPAGDVYLLGVLLYEMLTGRSPYPDRVATTILAVGRAAGLAPTPVLAVPGLPPELAGIVRGCMAKTPTSRPGSGEVARALRGVLDRGHRLATA